MFAHNPMLASAASARRLRSIAVATTVACAVISPARAEDTIKIGVLHSLSGTMAISETTLKDVMLMLVQEQNAKGGLLAKR